MHANIKKQKYDNNGSILATIQIVADTVGEDTAAFVVTKSYDGDPEVVNNVKFLSVASASDYIEYDGVPIFPGLYRTDKITVCIFSEVTYASFIATLIADLNKSAILSDLNLDFDIEYTFQDSGDVAGPFIFGSLAPEYPSV
jgi:hypothetical protein